MFRVRSILQRCPCLLPLLLLTCLEPAAVGAQDTAGPLREGVVTQDRAPTTTAVKLLITEVSVRVDAHEYIEITNRSGAAVDLSNYYLTDATLASQNWYYWRIAEGTPSLTTIGGGSYNDFHVRFPDGYVLADDQTIVISIAGSESYFSRFAEYPDLELYGTGPAPSMRPVFSGSINGYTTPRLDNTSECVILYHWDGTSDFVTDIDIFCWGSTASNRVCKTGVSIGDHTYADETAIAEQDPYLTATESGQSYQRIDLNETGQPGPPGNGVGGRDEVGEPWSSTWTIAAYDPGQVISTPEPSDIAKLLLTEISIIGNDQEFIEIFNPNDFDVDLSDYYLTDANHSTSNQYYWRIAEGNPQQTTVGGGVFNDFHARFPDGYILPAGQHLVVSIAGSVPFFNHFGFYPQLELYGTGPAPRMRPVFGSADGPNSIVGETTPTLTNTSEIVVLYYWDGASNLVTDIDVFMWGSTASNFFCKTGVTIGGETYQNETAIANQQPMIDVPAFGSSYHRTDFNETGQPGPPGNGVGGRDEVGEPLRSNWTIAAYDPAQPSAEGDPQILAAGIQAAYSDDNVIFRARVQPGTNAIDAVILYYRIDGGSELSLECTDAGGGYWEADLGQHPTGTTIAWRLVVNAGGDEAAWPAGGGTEMVTVEDPPEPGVAAKLLLTEISILGNDQEYIEIFNPNDFDVDLSDYYLTDAIHSTGSQYYWRIAEGNPQQTTVGGGAFYDFHARFPAGYILRAGQRAVVSIAGAGLFYTYFGHLPHIELYGTGTVPRMRPVFGDINGPNSIVGETTPTLTNTSEVVVLYYWDGVSNLVTDIDVFFWGTTLTNRFCKTGVAIGGETYQNETAVASQQPMIEVPSFGFSYHRTDFEEAGQPGPPGNGVDGRDEVGEPLPSNWTIAAYDPAQPEDQVGPLGAIDLRVPPRTFVPDLENFAFAFSTVSGQETKVRILDLEGRLVLTLYDSRFDGLPPLELVWDGRDATFERVRAGMYVIHLQAVDRKTGKKTIKTAPVVVATRLKK